MNRPLSLMSLSTLLALSVSISPGQEKATEAAPEKVADTAKPASGADEAWKELEKLLKGPSERPKTMEEATKVFGSHFKSLDEKSEAFLKAHPEDPRRWELELNKLTSQRMRPRLGLTALSEAEQGKLAESIINAKDADETVRSRASYARLMSSQRQDAEKFTPLAEAHLKAFPKFAGNTSVLNMMEPKAQAKAVEAILADANADKSAKAGASFVRVMAAKEDASKFDSLAAEHEKAYPDFPGNREIESTRKQAASDKMLKEKPLDLKFTAVSGKEIDLAQMRGKVILVDFWATWCGPCMAEVPSLVATYEKLHSKGFEIIGISFDKDKAALDKITKEKKMTWEQYFDGEGWKNKFGQQYGINSIPRLWLVDKKGMVVDTDGRQDLEKKVEKLLAE